MTDGGIGVAPSITAAIDRIARGVWRLAVLLLLVTMFEPSSNAGEQWLRVLAPIMLLAGAATLRDILVGVVEIAEIGWRQAKGVEP